MSALDIRFKLFVCFWWSPAQRSFSRKHLHVFVSNRIFHIMSYLTISNISGSLLCERQYSVLYHCVVVRLSKNFKTRTLMQQHIRFWCKFIRAKNETEGTWVVQRQARRECGKGLLLSARFNGLDINAWPHRARRCAKTKWKSHCGVAWKTAVAIAFWLFHRTSCSAVLGVATQSWFKTLLQDPGCFRWSDKLAPERTSCWCTGRFNFSRNTSSNCRDDVHALGGSSVEEVDELETHEPTYLISPPGKKQPPPVAPKPVLSPLNNLQDDVDVAVIEERWVQRLYFLGRAIQREKWLHWAPCL